MVNEAPGKGPDPVRKLDRESLKHIDPSAVNTPKKRREHENKVKKSLEASTTEGMFNASSTSITTTFITPFALELGASNSDIGLLSAVQNFFNTISMLPGAKLTEKMPRKQIWMISQLTAKMFFWVPIMLLPFIQIDNKIGILLVMMALIAFFAGLRTPAWSSMMGDLVPLKIRGRYFGNRNMVTGIAGIAATLISGWMVVAYGFSIVFFLAVLLSALSIIFFVQMYEPPVKKVFHYKHSFEFNPRNWATVLRINKPLVLFTTYLFFMYFAVEIASPFYTVYMLRDLNIDYWWFSALTILGAAVRIISFRHWGRLEDKYGSRNILIVTGFFGCFTPFLWLFASNIPEIALIKIFDGFVWAGFDLIVFNYLLDITPANKRPQYVANHSFFVGLGVTMGDLVGAYLAFTLDTGRTAFLLWSGLQLIFLISFVLRIFVLALLAKVKEADTSNRDVFPVRYVFWHAMAVEPAHGIKHALTFTFRYPESVVRERESLADVKVLGPKLKVKEVS